MSLKFLNPIQLQLPVLLAPFLILPLPSPAGALVTGLLPLDTLGGGPTVLLPLTSLTDTAPGGG